MNHRFPSAPGAMYAGPGIVFGPIENSLIWPTGSPIAAGAPNTNAANMAGRISVPNTRAGAPSGA